jgi:membrane protein
MRSPNSVVAASFRRWWSADPMSMGAACAFYTLLSLAPLSIFLVVFFGWIAGPHVVADRLIADVGRFTGPQAAELVQNIINQSADVPTSIAATLVGLAIVVIGSLGMFGQIKGSLDRLWNMQIDSPFAVYIEGKIISFLTVCLLGITLIVSIGLSAAIPIIATVVGAKDGGFLLRIVGDLTSIGLSFFLLTFIFRYLPFKKVSWKSSGIGSIGTIVLFIIGRYLIQLYLTVSAPSSVYGAAGALIIILLWVYYSSQILFLGGALAIELDSDVMYSSGEKK